ncbi:uncharacterized protein LOC127448797 [Myxocyprinus asiaticus]|uniref:uncharacterized protein LOC127448797 n=1 Tax=Myxocyprinus asiaticus TaxID=70543 RepID=UPI002221733B|nr:uncharacterized protein LOC127448797 [Myxocyprinus asiaticus]
MEDEPRPDKSTLRTSETKDGTTEKEREICVDNNAGSVEGVDSAHMPSSFSSDFQESTAEGISDILEEQTLTEFCAETLENAGDVEEVPAGEETEPHLEIQTQNITFDSTTNEGERTEENIHDVSVLVKPIEVIGDIITVKSNVTTDSDFLQNDTPIDRNQEALKVSENENVENVSTVTDSGLLLRDVDTVGSREADIVPEKTEISINPEDSHRQELHSKLNPVAHKRKVGSTRRPLGGKKGQGKGKELHEGNVTLYSERNKEVETFDMEDEPRPDKSTLRTSETKDGTTEKEREICVDNNAGSVEGVDSAHMPSSFSSDFQESTAEGISDMLDEQTFTEFCAETMENAGDVEEVPVGEDTEPHLEIQSQNITGESSTNERERTEENIHDVSVLVKPIEVIGDTITVKSNVTTQSDFLQNDTPTDINQEALKVSENVENVSTVTDSGLSLRDVDTVGSREADTVPEKTEININPEDSHRLELHSILNPVAHKRKMGSTRRPLGGNKGQRKGKEHHDDNETLNSESIRNREVEIFDMEYGHGPDKSTLRTSETNDGTTKKEREKCVENKAGPVEGIDSAHMSSSCSSDFQASTAVGISDILDEQTLTEFCAETLENAGDVEEVPVVEGTEPQIETQTQNITFDSTTNEEERTEENIHDVSVLVKPIEVIGDIITVKSNVTTDSDFLQNDTPFDRNQEALKVSENENVENVFTVTDSGLLLRDVDTVGSREADIVPEKYEININPEDSHRLELHSVLNPVAQKRKMGSTRRPLGGNKGQGKGKELHEGNVTLFSERNKEVETFDMEDEPRPDKSTLRTSETKDGTTEKEREICVDNNAGSVEGVDSAHMPSSFSSDFQESTAEGISDILEEQTLTGFCAETLENSVDVEEVPAGEETEPHLEIQTQNITFDSTTNEGERTGENIHDVSVLVKPIEVIGDIITVKSNVTTDSDFLQNDTPIDRNQEALKVSENENVENVSTVTDSGLLLRDVDTVGSREADIVPEKTEISINPEDSHRQELHSKLNPVAHKRKVGSTRRPLGGKKGQGKGKELHEGNVTLYSERNKEVETFDMEDEPRPDKSTLRTSETKDGTTEKEREICVDNNAGSVEGVDSAHMPSSFSSDFQESTAEGISDMLDEQTFTEFCAETMENAGDVEEVPVGEDTEPHLEIQSQNITGESSTNERERTEENIHDVSVLVKPIEVIGDTITVKSNVTTQSDFLQNDTPTDINQEALKVSENVENVSTVTDSGLSLRDVDTVGSREADTVPEKTEININPEDSHRLELHSILNPVAHKRKMGSTRRPLGGNKGQRKGKEHHDDNETLNSESIRNREVEIFDMEYGHGPDKSTLRTSETNDGTTKKEREKCVENKAGPVEGIDSAHMSSSCSSDFQASTAVGISDILDEQTLTEFCAETLENAGDVEEVPVVEGTEPQIETQTQNITFDSTTNEEERTEENIHDVSVLVKPIEVIGDIITVKSNVTTDSDFLQNDTPFDRNQEALKVSENENVENVFTVTDSGLLLRDVDTVGSREADIVPEKTEISINPEDSHRQELHSKLNPVAHKRKVGSTRRPLGGKKGQGKGKELHEGNVTLYSERNKEVETFDMEDEPRPDKSTLRTSETKDGTTEKEREICVDNNAGSVEGVDSAHMPSSFSSDFQESTAEGISDMLDEQTFTEFCAETMENAGDVEEVPVGEDTEPHLEIQSQNITGESSTNERERTEENIHDVSVLVKPIEVIGDTITVKSNVTTQSDFLQNDTPTDINQEALKVSENVENVSTVTDSGLSLRDVDTVGSREADTVPEKTEININPEDSHRLELHSILNPVAHKRKMGSTRRPLGGNKDQRKGKEHHDDNETLNSESIRNREVEIFDMEDVHGPDKSTLRTSETKDGTTEKEREICVENNAGPVEGVDSAHMSSSFSSDFQESTAEGISDILDEQTFTEFYAESLENAGDVEEMPVGEDTEPHLEIQSQNITVESSTNEGERTEENIHDVSVLVKAIEVIGDIITVKSNVTTQSDFLQNDTPTDINQEALKVSENVENVSTVTDSGLSLRDVDTVDSREADTFPEKTEININPEDSHRLELHSVLNPVAHKLKMGSTRRPLGGNKGQRKGKEYHDDNETLNSESIRNREVEIFDMEDEHGPDKSTLRTSETKDGTTKKEREKCVENKAGPVEGIDSAHMSSSCSSDFQASTAVGISDILEEQTLTEFCAETLEIAGDVEEVPVVEGTEPQIETQTQTITFDSTTNEGERTEENIHDVSVLVKAIEVIGDTITVKSNVTTDSDFLQNDTPIDRNQEALKVSKNENVENVSTVTDSGLLLRDVDTVGSREAVTVPEKTEISIIPEDSHRQEVHSKLIPTVHKRKMGSTRRPLGGNKGQRKGKEHHDDKETFISESIFNKDKEVFSLEDEHSPDKSTFRSSETEYGDIELEKEMGVKNDSGAVKGFDSAHMPSSFSSDFQESTAEGISDMLDEQTLTEFQAESQDNAGDVEGVPVGCQKSY